MAALIVGRFTPWEDVLQEVFVPALGKRIQVKIHPELRGKTNIDHDLMSLLIRCQATRDQDRPLLAELQQSVEAGAARPARFYRWIPGIDPGQETDEAITGLIQNYVLNETNPFWPADIPLPDDVPDTPLALNPRDVPLPPSPRPPLHSFWPADIPLPDVPDTPPALNPVDVPLPDVPDTPIALNPVDVPLPASPVSPI